MKQEWFTSYRLVKSEDITHRATLFAGRACEWIVEAGVVAAASLIDPFYLVCLKVSELRFMHSVVQGDILCLQSSVVYAGRSSVVAYVKVTCKDELMMESFITYVKVDDQAKPTPHGIVIETETEEEKQLQQRALALPK